MPSQRKVIIISGERDGQRFSKSFPIVPIFVGVFIVNLGYFTGVPAADGVQSEEEDEEDSATYSSGNKDKSQTSVSSTPDKKENMKKLLDIKPLVAISHYFNVLPYEQKKSPCSPLSQRARLMFLAFWLTSARTMVNF